MDFIKITCEAYDSNDDLLADLNGAEVVELEVLENLRIQEL